MRALLSHPMAFSGKFPSPPFFSLRISRRAFSRKACRAVSTDILISDKKPSFLPFVLFCAMLIEKEMDSLMDCQRLPFMPDTPDDDLVLLHQYHVSETYPMHSHEFYEIFYVVKGAGAASDQRFLSDCDGGLAGFHPSDDVHCYQLLNFSDFEFINVNISGADRTGFPLDAYPRRARPTGAAAQHQADGPGTSGMRRRFTELFSDALRFLPGGAPSARCCRSCCFSFFTRQGLDKGAGRAPLDGGRAAPTRPAEEFHLRPARAAEHDLPIRRSI